MGGCPEKEEDIREAIAELFLKLNDHLKALRSSRPCNHDDGHTTLNGANVGAEMIIHPRDLDDSKKSCYSINIYVNNNVQGVNNSILMGSKVSMRDPGACLHFPSCYNRDDQKGHGSLPEKSTFKKRKMDAKRAPWSIPLLGVASLLFVIVFLLVF